jgi:hypothetical protein
MLLDANWCNFFNWCELCCFFQTAWLKHIINLKKCRLSKIGCDDPLYVNLQSQESKVVNIIHSHSAFISLGVFWNRSSFPVDSCVCISTFLLRLALVLLWSSGTRLQWSAGPAGGLWDQWLPSQVQLHSGRCTFFHGWSQGWCLMRTDGIIWDSCESKMTPKMNKFGWLVAGFTPICC